MDSWTILGVATMLILIWWGSGWYVLPYNEYAAVDLLGNPWKEVGPGGPHWRPRWFSKVHRKPTTQDDFVVTMPPVQFGGAETTMHFDENMVPRRFHELPVTRQRELLDQPLHRPFAAIVNGIFFLRYRKGELFPNMQRFDTPADMHRHLREISKIALHDKLGKITAGTFIEHRGAVSALFEEGMRALTGDWNFELVLAHVGPLELPPEVERANRDVAVALANKQGTIATAEAERVRLRLVGEGRAQGIDSLRKVMTKESGKEAAALTLGTEAFKGSNVDLIVTPDSITGALAGLRTILK